MRKCSGNNTQEWGFDAIFQIQCAHCGYPVEFFKDEIKRTCRQCKEEVVNDRKDFGCERECSSGQDAQIRNTCSKFIRSKRRFYGHF